MPFLIRPYRRFPVQCAVTYYAGPGGRGNAYYLTCFFSRPNLLKCSQERVRANEISL